MNSLEQPDAKVAKAAQKAQKEQPPEEDCSGEIIGAAVEVQRVLGTGLLESAYAAALAIELEQRGLKFEREVPIRAQYKGHDVGVVYRADFLVQRSIVVELKATQGVADAHRAQLLTYLRLSGHKIGLLLNFDVFPLTKAIQRVVNKL